MFVYPRQGQNLEQQELDHYECHIRAVDQSDFDPTMPPPVGRSIVETAQKSADYLRALEICLDGRGYSLR
jgi:hypothetical protein